MHDAATVWKDSQLRGTTQAALAIHGHARLSRMGARLRRAGLVLSWGSYPMPNLRKPASGRAFAGYTLEKNPHARTDAGGLRRVAILV